MTGKGAFKGISFQIIDDCSINGSHRLVKHEYPLRDDVDIQNMGRSSRSYTINVVIIGKDYLARKNALIDALEASGPGELEHPNYDTITVMIDEWSCRESTLDGGIATFTINYTPYKTEAQPAEDVNQLAVVEEQQKGLLENLADEFSETWDKINVGREQLEAAMEAAESAINQVTQTIRGLTNQSGLSSLLGNALALKGSISNLISVPGKFIKDLGGLFSGFKSVFSFSSGSKKRSHTGPVARALKQIIETQDRNYKQNSSKPAAEQLKVLMTVLAISELCLVAVVSATHAVATDSMGEQATQADDYIESVSDCISAQQEIAQQINNAVIAVSDIYWPNTAQALITLGYQTQAALKALSVNLPPAKVITVNSTEPALVTLFRETGDSRHIERFIRRNQLHHPSFIIGQTSVEVINE